MPTLNAGPSQVHSVLIIGYDDEHSHLIFRNSWGVKWGDKGHGYIPLRYFERFHQEAWIIPPDGVILPSFTGWI
jgi:C1A family cysteine protease